MELQIIKHTSSLGSLVIKVIDKSLAKEMVIKNHYSHKWNDGGFGKFNFGIFKIDEPNKCLGCSVFGYMKNPKAKIFEHPNPHAWICELNRLWVDYTLGKNTETIFISASIKLLRKLDPNIVAVQSFADGRLGCGTIYKAANFKYYGFHHTRFLKNIRTSEMVHEQLFTNTTSPKGYIRNNIACLLGDMEGFPVRTYRYIYPLSKHFRFKLPELPYPEYNKGIIKIVWKRDNQKIKRNIISLLDKIVK